MAGLYANENFAFGAVEALRRLGHDVLTVLEAGKAEQAIPDPKVLEFAVEQDRAVLTFNRKHFIQRHRNQPDHKGIIVCTYDADFKSLANRIHTAISTDDDLDGQLIRVNRPLK